MTAPNEENQEMDFEQAFADLEEIIKKLEEGKDTMSIEEIAGFYAYGVDLMQLCEENLDKVEKQLETIDEKEDE